MRIDLYRITRCGFYARGKSQLQFGGLSNFLDEFVSWVANRPDVSATATFEEPGNIPDQILCSACTRLENEGVALSLWNRAPGTENGVAYIRMDGKPGAVDATERKLPKNSVAGWPRFFWIDPQSSVLVALIPEGTYRTRSAGLPAARRYLRAYLEKYSPYAVTAVTSEDAISQNLQILGWRDYDEESPDPTLRVKFDTRPIFLPGPIEEILANYINIRKLVTSVRVRRDVPDIRSSWEKAMESLGWDAFQMPDQDCLNFRFEVDWQPTHNELQRTIGRWKQSFNNMEQRTGVMLRGSSKVLWFDKARCTNALKLDEHLEKALHWGPSDLEKVVKASQSRVRKLISLTKTSTE